MNVNPDFYDDSKFTKHGLSLKKAKEVGDAIGVNWDEVDLGEFCQGIKEEMEHGTLYTDSPVAAPGATKVHDDSFESVEPDRTSPAQKTPNIDVPYIKSVFTKPCSSRSIRPLNGCVVGIRPINTKIPGAW
jgi:hypothetical protein